MSNSYWFISHVANIIYLTKTTKKVMQKASSDVNIARACQRNMFVARNVLNPQIMLITKTIYFHMLLVSNVDYHAGHLVHFPGEHPHHVDVLQVRQHKDGTHVGKYGKIVNG